MIAYVGYKLEQIRLFINYVINQSLKVCLVIYHNLKQICIAKI
jgi:hypothetical protein